MRQRPIKASKIKWEAAGFPRLQNIPPKTTISIERSHVFEIEHLRSRQLSKIGEVTNFEDVFKCRTPTPRRTAKASLNGFQSEVDAVPWSSDNKSIS
jgi:hypothetical protein